MIGQLLCHLWGDYILQSDWMAQNKTKRFWPACVHACMYTCAFTLLTSHSLALSTILVTHFFIDRYRLARYVVWAKNWMAPNDFYPARWEGQEQKSYPRRFWPLCACPTGYPPDAPAFLAVWLLIIADNTLHLTINYLALRYL